jgi:alpha-beta hydrolase superfamily lysophospholipase
MEKKVIKTKDNFNVEIDCYCVKIARAKLVIVHGAAEHIERYGDFVKFLNKNHVDVYCYDLHGHGRNRDKAKNSIFIASKNGDKILVNELADVCRFARDDAKDLPLFVLGHSMGSLIVRVMLIDTDISFKGVILSGSMNVSNVVTKGGIALGKGIKAIQGNDKVNSKLNHLAFGRLHERISYNEDNISNYLKDENCGLPFTNAAIIDLLTLAKEAASEKNIASMQKTNYLFISGLDDLFSDKTRQIKTLVNVYEKNQLKTEYHFYHGMKHEILHEDGKEDVYRDIFSFIGE